MPALKKTDYTGTVTWLGVVRDREAALDSQREEALRLRFAGPEMESHAGLTRLSCARVTQQHPLGTPIRNSRQLSILSAEELAAIAADMGVAHLDPAWLGATLVIQGLPDLTHLPPSARLQGPDGATLTVDMENRPCVLPARGIEAHLPGKGALFKAAAQGRRGVVAWVEREGSFRIGDEIRLHIPDQRPWQP